MLSFFNFLFHFGNAFYKFTWSGLTDHIFVLVEDRQPSKKIVRAGGGGGNEDEWPGKVEISRVDFLTVGEACKATFCATPDLESF